MMMKVLPPVSSADHEQGVDDLGAEACVGSIEHSGDDWRRSIPSIPGILIVDPSTHQN